MKTFLKLILVLLFVSSSWAENPTNSHGSTEPVNGGLLHNICKLGLQQPQTNPLPSTTSAKDI
jgi:hypothetical protein